MKKRIISLFLAIVMSVSLFVFSAPVAGAAYVYAPEQSLFQTFRSKLLDVFDVWYPGVTALNDVIASMTFPHVGLVTPAEMAECQRYYNDNLIGRSVRLLDGDDLYRDQREILTSMGWKINPNDFFSEAYLLEDKEHGIWRLADTKTNQWIVDSNGNFPFYYAGNEPPEAKGPRWLSASGSEITNGFSRTSYEALSALQIELSVTYNHPCELVKATIGPAGKGVECWAIRDTDWYYYCDGNGNRYAAVIEPSVTETVRPTVDNSGNLIVGDEGVILDIENGVLNLIDQVGDKHQLTIEDLEFDFGDDSYTVNAYTTNIEGDEYHYTYYTYNIQYNITNTYITYIGSNEPYEREEYELYYQLPDGRSSADLTAEEIAGMSFEFYDIVNYQRSTDDVSVRALYHFDGNLEDSSYFTGQHSGLVWTEGASITYMESPGAFEGNLYLDNTAHSFRVYQPSPIGTGDFQIQFRYYQASEPDTLSNIENRLNIGGVVLRWDESRLYNGDIELCALPIGTWNEICVSRYDGWLYIYLNGLCVYSGLGDTYVPKFFDFTFGSSSRAYSMLDEFRVLNVCTIAGADNYTCTVVPYDSNLVLVLPDVDRPLADEYYIIHSDPNDIFNGRYNFTGLSAGDTVDGFYSSTFSGNYNESLLVPSYNGFSYYSDYTVVTAIDGAISLSSSSITDDPLQLGGLGFCTGSNLSANKTYTLTLVLSDYSVHNLTFNTAYTDNYNLAGNLFANNLRSTAAIKNSSSDGQKPVVTCPGGRLLNRLVYEGRNSSKQYIYYSGIFLNPVSTSQTLDIAYMSLVEGTSTSLSVEKVTAIFGRDDIQPNTAAIQTTIPVKGYTVGGVRPSMPSRGDCWFPVMENRITSVQIYTGTHWEEVNARWWTGSRWIPIYAFDINTLEDLFDIADGDTVVPLFPDQNSFLRWWQLQWLDFRNWLENALSNIGSGGGTTLPDDETLPGDEGDGWTFVDLLIQTKDGLWKITKGVVKTAAGGITGLVLLINDAGSFFDPYQSGHTDGVMDLFNYGGDDIWD